MIGRLIRLEALQLATSDALALKRPHGVLLELRDDVEIEHLMK
jgi:hypothetical protein